MCIPRRETTKLHPWLYLLSIFFLCSLIIACDGGDDPISLAPQVPEMGGRVAGVEMAGTGVAGIEMAGIEMAGTGIAGIEVAGAEVETICEVVIDKERFATDVGPSLITTCATAFCHEPDGPTSFDLPVSALDFSPPLAGTLLDDTLNAVMGEDDYIVPGEPQRSKMLVYASNGHGGVGTFDEAGPDYTALSTWIKDMYQCREVEQPQAGIEPEAGEMAGDIAGTNGDPNILCDLLPNGDPQNRANGAYYQVFRDEANGILTNSCGSSGCHASPENGFWLRGEEEICSVESNFLVTQTYINFADPNRSPILEAAYDPYHSGYTIFTGRNDPRFITLQSWILLGFEE